jgi:hypothetical protein
VEGGPLLDGRPNGHPQRSGHAPARDRTRSSWNNTRTHSSESVRGLGRCVPPRCCAQPLRIVRTCLWRPLAGALEQAVACAVPGAAAELDGGAQQPHHRAVPDLQVCIRNRTRHSAHNTQRAHVSYSMRPHHRCVSEPCRSSSAQCRTSMRPLPCAHVVRAHVIAPCSVGLAP